MTMTRWMNEIAEWTKDMGTRMAERKRCADALKWLKYAFCAIRSHAADFAAHTSLCRIQFRWTPNILYFKRLFRLNDNVYAGSSDVRCFSIGNVERLHGELAGGKSTYTATNENGFWKKKKNHSPGPFFSLSLVSILAFPCCHSIPSAAKAFNFRAHSHTQTHAHAHRSAVQPMNDERVWIWERWIWWMHEHFIIKFNASIMHTIIIIMQAQKSV